MNITPQSLTYFKHTRCHIGKQGQSGRLTLIQAAEIFDAVNCVKTCCMHAFQYALPGQEMPNRFTAILGRLNGNLSLTQARKVLSIWTSWTWCGWTGKTDSFPTLSKVEGFIRGVRDAIK